MHRISDIIIFRNIWIFVILAVKDILYALQKGIYALQEFEEFVHNLHRSKVSRTCST
jgi:hypothetical protein